MRWSGFEDGQMTCNTVREDGEKSRKPCGPGKSPSTVKRPGHCTLLNEDLRTESHCWNSVGANNLL